MNSEVTFHTFFWILLALVMLMRVFFAWRVRRASERVLPDRAAIEREGRLAFAFRAAAFFLLLALLVLYAMVPPWIEALDFGLPPWLRWVGFVFGLASLGLWTWSQVALDTLWSAQLQLRQEHRLVSSGPYARMRHPLYTAMCGWGVALALVTSNWIFAAIALAVFAVFFIRVPKEEQMMIEQFGDEYRAFMKRTGRFLPKF